MPIKFRCVYCNQLLGISRRKAGTIVACTNCQGQIIVPEPKAAAAPVAGPDRPLSAANDLFEKSDIEQVLKPINEPVIAEPPQPPLRSLLTTTKQLDAAEPGVTLTTGQLTLLSAGVVLLIGTAFAAGLLLGLSMR